MEHQTDLAAYRSWLTHREYSPATIQKYTKALARFFPDTGAGDTPDRETVAACRDTLQRDRARKNRKACFGRRLPRNPPRNSARIPEKPDNPRISGKSPEDPGKMRT